MSTAEGFMTGFSETGDRTPVESSRYLQASGGRHNHGLKPARYHFVIRAILKREKSLKNMDFSDGWGYSHSANSDIVGCI